jgi:hypothetical protein
MKVIIVSLKYHPGHLSHIIAFSKIFREIGVECSLLIHEEFKKLDPTISPLIVNSLSLTDKNRVSPAFFLFPTLGNLREIIKIKIFTGARVTYVFHEPINSYKEFHKAGFNYLQLLRLFFVNLVNKITVLMADHIILPSNRAISIYELSYRKFNNSFTLVPLLFDDERKHFDERVLNNRFISYIGSISPDHAFDKFVDFVQYSLDAGLFRDNIFLIATGSILPENIRFRLDKYKSNIQLQVVEGKWLSNDEINKYFNQSFVIWNAYDRSTQSGVLPKAFMFGVPVLGNSKISNEYLQDNLNGIYLVNNSDVKEIAMSLEMINQVNSK